MKKKKSKDQSTRNPYVIPAKKRKAGKIKEKPDKEKSVKELLEDIEKEQLTDCSFENEVCIMDKFFEQQKELHPNLRSSGAMIVCRCSKCKGKATL